MLVRIVCVFKAAFCAVAKLLKARDHTLRKIYRCVSSHLPKSGATAWYESKFIRMIGTQDSNNEVPQPNNLHELDRAASRAYSMFRTGVQEPIHNKILARQIVFKFAIVLNILDCMKPSNASTFRSNWVNASMPNVACG